MTRDSDKRGRDRDDNDVHRPLEGDDRRGATRASTPATRGDARETVGDTARATNAKPAGRTKNGKHRRKPQRNELDMTIDKVSP